MESRVADIINGIFAAIRRRPRFFMILSASMVLVLIIVLIAGGGDGSGAGLQAVSRNYSELKRFHLVREKNIAERGLEEYTILPEKINIDSDQNYLKEAVQDTSLFDTTEDTVEYELNRLNR